MIGRGRMTKNILITGIPGVGKTTLIRNLSDHLAAFHPVGFYTLEIRRQGIRRGFEIISLDGRKELLSHIDIRSPYRIGRYGIDVEGFERLIDAIPFSDPHNLIVVLDEIGKMECFSSRFFALVRGTLDSDKPVLATVARSGGGLIAEVKRRTDVTLYELTQANRKALFRDVAAELKNMIASPDESN
jgi:nucleoside-triphosphatase